MAAKKETKKTVNDSKVKATSNKKTTNIIPDENVEANETKEVKEVKTVKEESFENGKKSVLKIVWNIVFWVVIIGLFVIWTIDFINVKNNKEPMFCIKEKTHQYTDGTTEECVGLGYKVFKYNRKSISKTSQFSPFFISMDE